LNAGNKRVGDAFGFKLDTLSKLCDTKTSDNQNTLLDVIVEMIKDSSNSELIHFPKDELEVVEKGSRVSLQTIQAEVGKLVKEFEGLTTVVTTVEKKSDEDIFLDKLQAFINENTPTVEKMKNDLEKMQKDFEELVKFFLRRSNPN